MKRAETIAGIDMGSNAVRVVVGQWSETGIVQIIGVGEAPSHGVTRGTITDVEEVMSSLSEALDHAERMTGIPITRAVAGIGSTQCKLVESRGVVAVSKINGEVQQSDVERAFEQSQAVATMPNYDIIDVLPRSYTLDNQTGIKDPVGMTGIRLEAITQVILAPSTQVKNVAKCLYRAQFGEGEQQVFAPIATARAVLNKRQRELGVAMVNIGAWTTSIAVYEEGELLHAVIMPIGSDHLTSDLAIGLRVDVSIAERVKVELGLVSSDKVSKRDEIDVAKYSSIDMPRTPIPRKNISEILESRLGEMCDLINTELKRIKRDGKLPAGIVLTGGGSKMMGIVDFMKEHLKLPVFLGTSDAIRTPIDRVKEAQFTTALGLVYSVDKDSEDTTGFKPLGALKGVASSVLRRFQGLLRR